MVPTPAEDLIQCGLLEDDGVIARAKGPFFLKGFFSPDEEKVV